MIEIRVFLRRTGILTETGLQAKEALVNDVPIERIVLRADMSFHAMASLFSLYSRLAS